MRTLWIALAVACSPAPRAAPDGPGGTTRDAATPDAPADEACAGVGSSYIGCSYWPVDLANAIDVVGPPPCDPGLTPLSQIAVCIAVDGTFAGQCDLPGGTCPTGDTCQVVDACGLDAQHSPFAVVVMNPGTDDASVTLTDAAGTTATQIVPAMGTATLAPQQLGFTDHSLEAPGIASAAYHLTSTRPIVAYQHNPLANVGVFSDDASLLLPENALGTTYVALSYPNMVRRPAYADWHGYATIVAPRDATVTVTPATDILAGGAPLVAHVPVTFAMHAFDTLELMAASGDISGTKIDSTAAVAAFAGHEATVIPDPFPFRNPCCADHLEEQLFPTPSWGKTFAISRGRQRVTQIHDYVRVVASVDGTVVAANPTLSWGNTCDGQVLSANQVCEIWLDSDIEIHASQPILVAHFMVSGGGISPDSGDPSLMFVPPVEQYRKTYAIAVPEQYAANDVTIAATTGGPVALDGADVSLLLAPFSSGAWSSTRISVTPGRHQIDCPMGCSVEVTGWDTAVSYGYSGGVDVAPIIE